MNGCVSKSKFQMVLRMWVGGGGNFIFLLCGPHTRECVVAFEHVHVSSNKIRLSIVLC